MSRLAQIAPETATGKTQVLFQGVQGKLGMVPNMMRVMGNSPAVLEAYLQFSGTLARGSLSAGNREQISLVVGEANGCDYCLAAHSTIGRMVGLTADQIRDSRQATAVDSKTNALLQFARKVVDARGRVDDEDVQGLREFGFTEGEVVEAVANVALSIFTNYFNHVAATDIDFPAAPTLETAGAAV